MSESARVLLELVERGWAELSAEERAAFEGWITTVQETAAPASVPPPKPEEP